MSKAYIVLYDQNQLCYLTQSLLTLQKFYNNGDIILSIINKNSYDKKNLHQYNEFLKIFENYHKIYYADYSDGLSNYLSTYVHKYEKFIVFNSSLLLLNNINSTIEINNNEYFVSRSNPKIGLGNFSRSKIIAILRNETSIQNIQYQLQNIDSDDRLITEDLIPNELDKSSTNNDSKTIFYENEHCLFAMFQSKNQKIKNSMAYMNKNNNKIYNINNNIFGNIIAYSDSSVTIEWKMDDKPYTYTYAKINSVFI